MSQKGFAPIIFILVIFIISFLIIGASFYLKHKITERNKSDTQNINNIQNSSKQDNYVNWKTYINSTYKFSIKYPPLLECLSSADSFADIVDLSRKKRIRISAILQ